MNGVPLDTVIKKMNELAAAIMLRLLSKWHQKIGNHLDQIGAAAESSFDQNEMDPLITMKAIEGCFRMHQQQLCLLYFMYLLRRT